LNRCFRCAWTIDREGDLARRHIEAEIHSMWFSIINKRLRTDCILTNSYKYKNKAIKPAAVRQTWEGTLMKESELHEDCMFSDGVLVGLEVMRSRDATGDLQ
jgi:hypothetical protein